MARIIFEDSAKDKFWIDDEGYLASDFANGLVGDEETIFLAPEDIRKFAYWLLSQTTPAALGFDEYDDEIEDDELPIELKLRQHAEDY